MILYIYMYMLCALTLCTLQPFGKSDTMGCYIDLDHCTISYSKNGEKVFSYTISDMCSVLYVYIHVHIHVGKILGKAFDLPKHLHGETFYAAVTLKVREYSHWLCTAALLGSIHTGCVQLPYFSTYFFR